MSKQFDAIIIGTGQSGPSLAARLAKEGMKVAIIERKLFGGTCVNTGCIPTKTLVSSAQVAHVARRVEEFGLTLDGSLTVDMKRAKERKDGIVAKSNQGVEKWLKGTGDSRIPTPSVSARRFWRRGENLHQCGRKGLRSSFPGHQGRPVPDQLHNDGGGSPPRDSGDPGNRRAQGLMYRRPGTFQPELCLTRISS